MENYLSRLNPDWPAPDYTQGRESYLYAPLDNQMWVYNNIMYYVQSCDDAENPDHVADLYCRNLNGSRQIPRMIAQLSFEPDSVYANAKGVFLLEHPMMESFGDEVEESSMLVARYDLSGNLLSNNSIFFYACCNLVDYYITGTTLYFCCNSKRKDGYIESKIFSFNFEDDNTFPAFAKLLLTIAPNSDFYGFDRILACGKWIFLRTKFEIDSLAVWLYGQTLEHLWFAYDADSCDGTSGQEFWLNVDKFDSCGVSAVCDYSFSSRFRFYQRINGIDLQHGLVWEEIPDNRCSAEILRMRSDEVYVVGPTDPPVFIANSNIYRVLDPEKLSPLANTYYFDGAYRICSTSHETRLEKTCQPGSVTFDTPDDLDGRGDALFDFFMVTDTTLVGHLTEKSNGKNKSYFAFYPIAGLNNSSFTGAVKCTDTILHKVSDDIGFDFSGNDNFFQSIRTIDLLPDNTDESDTDLELSDYDDPEDDIFSGLDLDALDEEPAPSAPARKAVARRVTPRSTAPRSTVTRQPSAPGDAKVLTSTDVKYGILTFGKKLADVPAGAPCTLYYNGRTYSCKAHNTTRGRIDGLRRLYIDNPELQEGARVTATYDDDEGEITLTLL